MVCDFIYRQPIKLFGVCRIFSFLSQVIEQLLNVEENNVKENEDKYTYYVANFETTSRLHTTVTSPAELPDVNEKQIEEKKPQEEVVTIFGFKKNKIYGLTKVVNEKRAVQEISREGKLVVNIRESLFYDRPTLKEAGLLKLNNLENFILAPNKKCYINNTKLPENIDTHLQKTDQLTFSWVELGHFNSTKQFVPSTNDAIIDTGYPKLISDSTELKNKFLTKVTLPLEDPVVKKPAPIFVITKINKAYRFFGKFIENKNTHATATTAELPELQEKYGQDLVQYDTNTYVVFNAVQTHKINGFDFGDNSCKVMNTVFENNQTIIKQPAWGPCEGLWDKIKNLSKEEENKAPEWVAFKKNLDTIIETCAKKRQNNNKKPKSIHVEISSTNNKITVGLKPENEQQIEEKKSPEEAVPTNKIIETCDKKIQNNNTKPKSIHLEISSVNNKPKVQLNPEKEFNADQKNKKNILQTLDKCIETCDKQRQDDNKKTTKSSINNWALPAFFSAICGGLQEYLDAKKHGTKLSYGTTIVPVALLSMHRMAKSKQTGWKRWMPVLTSAAGYGLGKLATHILYSSTQNKKQLSF